VNPQRQLLAAVAAAGLALCLVAADEVHDTFNSLYGKDIRRVKGTSGRGDDLAVAKELLKAAHAAGQVKLLTLLCESACELAEQAPGGVAIASAAMELLAEKVPAKKNACVARILRIHELQYARSKGFDRVKAGEMLLGAYIAAVEAKADGGDFSGAKLLCHKALLVARRIKSARAKYIQARSKQLDAREQVARNLRYLTGRLKDNPKDKFARGRLIQLYLVELDNPLEAAKWVNADCEELVRRLVPLAAKKLEHLTAAACLELGDWYRGLADGSIRLATVRPIDTPKPPLLRRAKGCYEECLRRHPEKDLLRTSAALGLEKVDAALEAAGQDISTAQLFDLLKLVDPRKDVLEGRCYREDGALTVEGVLYGIGGVMVPLVLEGSYELRASFSIVGAKGGGALLLLPVGQTNAALHLSTVCELWIRPQAAAWVQKPVQSLPRPLRSEQRHVLEVRVQPRGKLVRITVALNGTLCLRWQGPCAALGRWCPDHRCPLLGTHERKVTYHSADVRMLSGKGTPLRKTVAGKEIKVLVGKPLANGQWVELRDTIDPCPDCYYGRFERGSTGITWEREGWEDGHVLAPVQPGGGYRLRLNFTSTGGLGLLLPVGEGATSVRLSDKEGKLRGVKAEDAVGNVVTTRPGRLVKDRKHDLEVEVLPAEQEAEIKVILDGQPYLRWKGRNDEVLGPAQWHSRTWKGRRLGLFMHATRNVTLHSMKFLPLTGKSLRIR